VPPADCHPDPVAHAAATTAAVSTRNTRGPKLATDHPAGIAELTSAAVSPPSGPTANAIPPVGRSAGGPSAVCNTYFAAGKSGK
jgi:hypothetical protein